MMRDGKNKKIFCNIFIFKCADSRDKSFHFWLRLEEAEVICSRWANSNFSQEARLSKKKKKEEGANNPPAPGHHMYI